MSRPIVKLLAIIIALSFGNLALAMEPLKAISPDDPDFTFYSNVVNIDQKLVNDGWISLYSDFNMFNVNGRAVAITDGSRSNPYNLVLTVNGNLYYVDAILNTVDNFKIRRRWANNPEPGVFLRIEGQRVNPEDGVSELVQVWIKIATPEGRALPVLKLLEGNYDLSGERNLKLGMAKVVQVGEGNPGPVLPPPPLQRASELINGLEEGWGGLTSPAPQSIGL
jgi:hypothetical protein